MAAAGVTADELDKGVSTDPDFFTFALVVTEGASTGLVGSKYKDALDKGWVSSWSVGVTHPSRIEQSKQLLVVSEVVLTPKVCKGKHPTFTLTASLESGWVQKHPPPSTLASSAEWLAWFKTTRLAELVTFHYETIERRAEEVEAEPLDRLDDVRDCWPNVRALMHARLKVNNYEDLPIAGSALCRRDISSEDAALVSLEGDTMLSKLNAWVSAFYKVGNPVSLDAAPLEKVDVFYLFALLLWTRTTLYKDVRTLCEWLTRSSPSIVGEFLRFVVFEKRDTGNCISHSQALAIQLKLWCAKARVCVEDPEDPCGSDADSADHDPHREVDARGGPIESWALVEGDAKRFHYALDDWVTPGTNQLAFEPGQLRETMRQFLCMRDKYPRPARLTAMSEWPMPRPFEQEASGAYVASDKMTHLLHQRSATAQTHMIEMGGVLTWCKQLARTLRRARFGMFCRLLRLSVSRMDQHFHPLASWTEHLRGLQCRNRFLVRSEKRPRVTTAAYRRAIVQIRACRDAVARNDAAAFRSGMGVFCEKAFADEMGSAELSDFHSLSNVLGEMLELYNSRGRRALCDNLAKSVTLTHELLASEEGAAIAAWLQVINELALKADHVAVLVVDALCLGIGSAAGNFIDFVFDEKACSLARKTTTVAFTNTTAPLYLRAYWDRLGASTLLTLEATSRSLCARMPRARFPDSHYAQSVQKLVDWYGLFVREFQVDERRSGVRGDHDLRLALGVPDAFGAKGALAGALQLSIRDSHFCQWTPEEIVFAALAMVKHARWARQVQLRARSPAWGDATLGSEPFLGRLQGHSAPIFANLDQAEMMLDVVMSGGEQSRPAYDWASRISVEVFVREIKEV